MTDPDLIRNLHLDDPRPFFNELLTKTYRKRTVLSPHFYGMTVTNNTHTGHQLWEKFTQSWGKLQVRPLTCPCTCTHCCAVLCCQPKPVKLCPHAHQCSGPSPQLHCTPAAFYLCHAAWLCPCCVPAGDRLLPRW